MSTIPAKEQISHNGRLCLNQAHKTSREACRDPGSVGLCLKETCSFKIVLCCSRHEANGTTQLTSKQVFWCLDLCASSFYASPATSQFQRVQGTAKQVGDTKERKDRDNTSLTLTLHLSVKHLEWTLGGSSLSNPVNYSLHLYFFFPSDRLTIGQTMKKCFEI